MATPKHFAFRFTLRLITLCTAFSLSGVAFAQEEPQPPAKRSSTSVPITVSARGALVRFTAVGAIERMRLEVFDAAGVPVFDTGFKAGNMRDWRLRGSDGQLLPDSTYLCVVTVRELSGRMSFKQGSVLLQGGRAALALDGGGQPEGVEAERVTPEQALSTRPAEEPPSMTVTAHDGVDGQVTSTAGALTFRTGDLFSGKDREQMRLTEDGKLGIGTKEPQATLDVAGTIRASKGVAFPDGTVLTSATGRPQKMNAVKGEPEPLISGSGTTGRLTKWTNGPAGVLGDSVITESASNIGIGTGAPTSKLHVVGAIQIGATAGAGVNPTLINPNTLANFAQVRFYPASGTNVNTSFAVVPKGTGQPNNRAQFSILGTDSVANPSNTEFATFRARGTDFVLGTGKTGTGLNRPLMLSAGLLTDNVTNNNQLVLATDGNVGVGTNAPASKLAVSGGDLRVTGGDVHVETVGKGLKFPDGSVQTTSMQGALTGTGTTGTIPVFTAAGSLGDSVIKQVGDKIGIGAEPAASTFYVRSEEPFYTLSAYNFSSTTGIAGNFQIPNETNESTALLGTTSGLGRAGYFLIGNTANDSAALEAETDGTGFAGRFSGTGASSKGVWVNAGSGEIGLEVNRGRVILSYVSITGGAIPTHAAVVNVQNDDDAGTQPTVALPEPAENGMIIIVGTGDPQGAEITGANGGPHTVNNNNSRRFVRIGNDWKTEP